MVAELIVKRLSRLPLFQRLTLPQLTEIAGKAEIVEFKPGAVITEENSEADAAVLLVAGDAVRVSGPELKSRMEPVPSGSLLCESAMLVDTHYGSTIVARTHVFAARITQERLHAQILSDPLIGEWLVQALAARLSLLADELREVESVLSGTATRLPAPPPAAPTGLSIPVQ